MHETYSKDCTAMLKWASCDIPTSIKYRKLLGCLIYGLSEKQTNPNEYLIGASVENASIWRVKPWPYCWQTQGGNNYRKQKYKSIPAQEANEPVEPINQFEINYSSREHGIYGRNSPSKLLYMQLSVSVAGIPCLLCWSVR